MQVCIKRDNGVLKIDIDGNKYMPLSFKSFRPNPQNVSEFYDAGVRLFSVLSSGVESALGVPYSLYGESWIGEGQYDFSVIDKQMDMFIENAPEGYFAPMLQLDTRKWYLKAHPEMPNSFLSLSQMCMDEEWRKAAGDYLKAAVEHCEEKYGDKIYGYFILCGTTTEWFSGRDEEAPHPMKEKAFKKWIKDENAVLPSIEEYQKTGEVFLSSDEQNVYNSRRFQGEVIADTALHFASLVKEVTNRKKLVGMYYGYLLELSNERIFNFGHLGYEKVYLSEDVDMISSPSSYEYRGIYDPSAFMVTQKTLDKHNKLYFLEFDHITHVAPTAVSDKLSGNDGNCTLTQIPGAESKCKTPEESLNLMLRDYILCNAHGTALWWFDMFDGWFRSPEMMETIKKLVEINKAMGNKETSERNDIAVFFEGEAMYHVRKTAKLENYALENIRKSLASCGASYELYSISDLMLDEISEYKLIIFANQYELSDEKINRINELKKTGVKILYMYAPGYITETGYNIDNISKLVGMNVKVSNKDNGAVLVNDTEYHYNTPSPYFYIEDLSVSPIACYKNGRVACACKDGIIYNAACGISPEIIREAARYSGIHVCSESNEVYTYVNSESVGIYNASEKEAVISLKQDGAYEDMIDGSVYKCQNGKLVLPPAKIRAHLLIKKD